MNAVTLTFVFACSGFSTIGLGETSKIRALRRVDENPVYHQNRSDSQLPKSVKTKCYEDLGCFSNDNEFYHPIRRPFNLLPDDRESINTRFLLYTRRNIKQYQLLKAKNKESIQNSEFKPGHETKFVVHGYIDNQLFGEWMRVMKNEFLMHDEYNVIIVDWSGGNGLPYTQASSNARVVGAEIAFLISYLKENFGLKPESVHILGHSLGSHVAGYAGERTKGLGRITGLDPAEPFFQGLPEIVRIDPSDANFVDVIHTDAKSILLLGLGMNDLVGHVDFFPNDGNDHPGCDLSVILSIVTDGLAEGVRRFLACNHQRAVDFMIDSINNIQCNMVGLHCKDWETFTTGTCTSCGEHGERCAILGLRAIENKDLVEKHGSQGRLYFKTAEKSPFCVFQYQIILKLEDDRSGDAKEGYVTITLKGRKRDETFKLGENEVEFSTGRRHTFLVKTQQDLGAIDAVVFLWTRRDGGIIPEIIERNIYLQYVKVYLINRIPASEGSKKVLSYCDVAQNPIENKRKVLLLPQENC